MHIFTLHDTLVSEHAVDTTANKQQTVFNQQPLDSFITGESVALLVLDAITVKCWVLLLSGKHC